MVNLSARFNFFLGAAILRAVVGLRRLALPFEALLAQHSHFVLGIKLA